MVTPKLSIIIPVLNEARTIVDNLNKLQKLQDKTIELIVVDGGSSDETVDLATPLADLLVFSELGRAKQMNAGAAQATGEILLFLHADTNLPYNAVESILNVIEKGYVWGRFDVTISGKHFMLRVISFFINWRSRFSGIATGDQGIFVKKSVFKQIGGFPVIAIMEDIALSDLLKAIAKPACLRCKVKTSGRRWEKYGVWRTIFLMWRLRAAYRLGATPESLAQRYPS